MIPAKFRWEWKLTDDKLAAEWAGRLGIPLLVARVLLSRGWSEEEAARFFRPADEEALEDPLLMKGMPEAAERIRRAIAAGERIRVYGDYDADGVTSTALMIRLFSVLGASFDTYIPHRSLEGYGLNLLAIDAAAEAGVSLIVTVDNGISAVEQIAYARKKGIDVVVTDHHEPPAVLPEAVALVNPKQPGCPYPFKGLCGAGVAFKLAHVLLGRPATEFADLAAVGTVADLMPLIGENRIIVRMGLDRMRREPSAGIRALAKASGTEPKDLTSGRIGFGLAPRLNAGGRLERADGAVRLLTTEDEKEAVMLAEQLDRLNSERQRLVDVTVEEAERMWQAKKAEHGGNGPEVIVLHAAGWNAGIAGLVASKLVERHYRPAVVLAHDPETGKCKGSARSIDGFDLYAALTDCAHCMEHYGGHQAAAGLTIEVDRIPELERLLHDIARERLTKEDRLPKKRADLLCELAQVTLESADGLAALEPFGNGHSTPRFLLQDVTVRESRTMGKEGKHLKVTVERDGCSLEAIGFGMGHLAEKLPAGRSLDLLGELSVNEWNGSRRVQFVVQDLASSETLWIDRRKSADPWSLLESWAARAEGRFVVLCASSHLAEEVSGRGVLRDAEVYAYTEPASASSLAAAAKETVMEDVHPAADSRLVLFGLPDNEADQRVLADWLSKEPGWGSIMLMASPSRQRENPVWLQRRHFAEGYALFREQKTWIDGPEGFLRKAADRLGLPLASIRLMQDVFEELGFIRASGAERTLVSEPPKRNLEESQRYRKMAGQAEAASFPDWPLERLKAWAAANKS
ncbi:single-stranded-DNA-specific exonuclease RecJ [Cohnella pontilimi]|uniref:Single-stranded-DNA-specific exonuclease RecJ n=1 Tax=Cohnella pontilimi TaxID=2564100 RepID=A0A4U0FDR6_9BACL|nr:single-stranded-DNA-specific exonuclease RecJ [Cohnella pontilimi]TJY41412.1 single-stranded-DNA-specific exonuclease RecJ [Cohnella pontilimi]